MSDFKGWFRDNQPLAIALAAQAIIAGIYMVNLENRMATLETRGSPHLAEINTRLTTLEKLTDANKESIDRIKDVLTKNLNVYPK